MPCNCDYLEATEWEKSCAEIFSVLDEIDGNPIEKWGNPYDDRVYSKKLTKEDMNPLIARACRELSGRGDISDMSLETQTWWRDHQEADRVRAQQEENQRKDAKDREAALSKLTERERQLLGVR